jgi:hypothetical protein
MGVLDVGASKRGQLLFRILIAIMSEASLMVTACDGPNEVGEVSDATIEWVARLTT